MLSAFDNLPFYHPFESVFTVRCWRCRASQLRRVEEGGSGGVVKQREAQEKVGRSERGGRGGYGC